MKFRLTPTIANNVYAVTLVLLLLMGLITVVGTTMSLRVGSMVAGISDTYMPAYGMLARVHIRSLEQSFQLRRAALLMREGGDAAQRDAALAGAELAGQAAEKELANALLAIKAEIGRHEDSDNLLALGHLLAGVESLAEDRVAYDGLFADARGAIAANDWSRTIEALSRLDDFRDRMGAHMEDLRREALSLAGSTVEQTRSEQQKVIFLSLMALAVAVLFGLLMAARIARRLVGSVRPLVNATRAVEQGSYSGELTVRTNDEIGQLTGAFNHMIRELALKDRIRATFGRYMDPRLVEGLVDRQDLTGSAGDRRVLTILFCDMRGFTHLSEQVTPPSLVAVLNRYLGLMAGEVKSQNGVIDKFIGDSVMAFFGPPFVPAHEQGQRACAAGLAQLARFEEFRAEVPALIGFKQYVPDIGIRVGIATGEVVVGNIGSEAAMNYTVIGDTVNAASRIEGANKIYGTSMLIDGETAAMVRDSLLLREIDRVLLLGKEEPMTLFEIAGPAGSASSQAADVCKAYESGLAAHRARNWSAAKSAFKQCLALKPGDGPATVMLERTNLLARSAPPANWDGTFVLSGK